MMSTISWKSKRDRYATGMCLFPMICAQVHNSAFIYWMPKERTVVKCKACNKPRNIFLILSVPSPWACVCQPLKILWASAPRKPPIPVSQERNGVTPSDPGKSIIYSSPSSVSFLAHWFSCNIQAFPCMHQIYITYTCFHYMPIPDHPAEIVDESLSLTGAPPTWSRSKGHCEFDGATIGL